MLLKNYQFEENEPVTLRPRDISTLCLWYKMSGKKHKVITPSGKVVERDEVFKLALSKNHKELLWCTFILGFYFKAYRQLAQKCATQILSNNVDDSVLSAFFLKCKSENPEMYQQALSLFAPIINNWCLNKDVANIEDNKDQGWLKNGVLTNQHQRTFYSVILNVENGYPILTKTFQQTGFGKLKDNELYHSDICRMLESNKAYKIIAKPDNQFLSFAPLTNQEQDLIGRYIANIQCKNQQPHFISSCPF